MDDRPADPVLRVRERLEALGYEGEVRRTEDTIFTVEDASRAAPPEHILKSLLVRVDRGPLALVLLSGPNRVDLKKAKSLLGARNLVLADPDTVWEQTGPAPRGGSSPGVPGAAPHPDGPGSLSLYPVVWAAAGDDHTFFSPWLRRPFGATPEACGRTCARAEKTRRGEGPEGLPPRPCGRGRSALGGGEGGEPAVELPPELDGVDGLEEQLQVVVHHRPEAVAPQDRMVPAVEHHVEVRVEGVVLVAHVAAQGRDFEDLSWTSVRYSVPVNQPKVTFRTIPRAPRTTAESQWYSWQTLAMEAWFSPR